jgi:hypothetical protein
MIGETARPWRHAAAVGLLLLAHVHSAPALSDGITGNSGKQGETCADRCHYGGTAPLVRFEGPAAVPAGTAVTFRFAVHSQSLAQSVAGFNVAADGGLLDVVSGEGARAEADELGSVELAHDAPKANVDDEAAWEFVWHAPTQPGPVTLYGAGLSGNDNHNPSGDEAATATLVVEVTRNGPPGDANCDTRLSAADLTAVLLQWPPAVPSCLLADADCDGIVGDSDLALLVPSLFDPAANHPPCS